LLASTPQRISEVAARLGTAGFERSYAPGKWDAREILMHLGHTEVAFGFRARLALITRDYVVQPFDQDALMAREPRVEGALALQVYRSVRSWNLALFRSLTSDERSRRFLHPERGELTVWWIAELLAGHDRHHLEQLETIAGGE
jgi:hypothetical protein